MLALQSRRAFYFTVLINVITQPNKGRLLRNKVSTLKILGNETVNTIDLFTRCTTGKQKNTKIIFQHFKWWKIENDARFTKSFTKCWLETAVGLSIDEHRFYSLYDIRSAELLSLSILSLEFMKNMRTCEAGGNRWCNLNRKPKLGFHSITSTKS